MCVIRCQWTTFLLVNKIIVIYRTLYIFWILINTVVCFCTSWCWPSKWEIEHQVVKSKTPCVHSAYLTCSNSIINGWHTCMNLVIFSLLSNTGISSEFCENYFCEISLKTSDYSLFYIILSEVEFSFVCGLVTQYTPFGVILLKQYSEIFGWLKHPFSVTPIDRYSLKQLMFKILVGYDFTLVRYEGLLHWILYCNFWCPCIRI